MFDVMQFVGIGGAPTIQQMVQYLKNDWKLPTYLAPIAAVILGIVINVGLAFYLKAELQPAILVGTLTGFVASGWHEIAKK